MSLSAVITRWSKLKTDAVMHASFTTTATIQRKSIVSDGAGGQVDTYTNLGPYECSFSKFLVRPAEREKSEMIQAFSDWEFRFARSVTVQPTDRIVCEGRTFEVVGQGIASYDSANHVLTIEIV